MILGVLGALDWWALWRAVVLGVALRGIMAWHVIASSQVCSRNGAGLLCIDVLSLTDSSEAPNRFCYLDGRIQTPSSDHATTQICTNINPAPKTPDFCTERQTSSTAMTHPRTPPKQPPQNSQTYQNKTITAAKNPTHTLHPTPVRSAIRSILFIVPRNRTRVLSNESFIRSARAEESRISSPIATVIYTGHTDTTHQLATLLSAARTDFLFFFFSLGERGEVGRGRG